MSDTSAIQGEWQFVTAIGWHRTTRVPSDVQLIFDGEMLLYQRQGRTVKTWRFSLDGSFDPSHFNWTTESGMYEGTYRLEDDRLTVCLPRTPRDPRPTTTDIEKHGFGWEMKKLS